MSEAAIQEAMKAEYVFMQDEIERWQYEQREKAIRDDYISGMRSSQREGMKRGMEEGLKQGIEQGLKQGIEQTSLQNLKNLMKNMNLTAEQAMEILQISASEREKYMKLLHM